jgi:hypothetical protein
MMHLLAATEAAAFQRRSVKEQFFFGFAKLATEAAFRSRTGRNRADGLQQGIVEATLYIMLSPAKHAR